MGVKYSEINVGNTGKYNCSQTRILKIGDKVCYYNRWIRKKYNSCIKHKIGMNRNKYNYSQMKKI